MKETFIYSGPAQSLQLREPKANGEGTELRAVDFQPGQPVELLPDHKVTIAFQAASYLTPAEPAPSAPADDTAPATIAPPAEPQE